MTLVLAVGVTWVLMGGLIVALGWWVRALLPQHTTGPAAVRAALWFGLAMLVLALMALNLVLPLRSGVVWAVLVVLAFLSVAVGVVVGRRRSAFARTWSVSAAAAATLVVLIAALVVAAHSFAGPADNWDAGLYHLNAMQYAAEFRTIPGLANLHDRLGTNVSSTLVAALLSSTGWGWDAFRLLAGLFMALAAGDVVLRLVDRDEHRRGRPGTVLILVGVAVSFAFLLDNASQYLTSPTPDSVALLLSIVAAGYLVDAFYRHSQLDATVAVIVAVTAATVRTQLWVFAGVLALVVVVRIARRSDRALTFFDWLGIATTGLTGVLLVTALVRDAILSGWLLFPASLVPLPADWRVPDPGASREWILSWARDPSGTPETVLGSWNWLWPWVGRTADDWAVRYGIGFVVAALVLGLTGRAVAGRRIGWRGMALLLAPFVIALVVWFWSAPDPRFAWGLLIVLGLAPLALTFAHVLRGRGAIELTTMLAAALSMVVLAPVVAAGLVQIRGFVAEGATLTEYRFGPVVLTANVNAVTSPGMAEFVLNDGNVIYTPTDDDRCYLAFPLCRPYPDATMQFRGVGVQDGFRYNR